MVNEPKERSVEVERPGRVHAADVPLLPLLPRVASENDEAAPSLPEVQVAVVEPRTAGEVDVPSRIIRESALTSRSLNALSDLAERLFWRLTIIADDHGRFDAEPAVLLARCFPLKVTALKLKSVTKARDELVSTGTIVLYQHKNSLLGYFPSWFDHQRTRETKSKYPDPPQSAATCGEMPQVAAWRREKGEGVKEKGEEEATPTVSAQDILEAWERVCVPRGLAAVREFTETRRKKLGLRVREHPSFEWWDELFRRIAASGFLLGNGTKGWKVSFDWLIDNDTNVVKVLEGRYGHGR